MKKGFRRAMLCILAAALIWAGSAMADRQALSRELIRLHVVAASDSPEDQAIKLRVRDAVLENMGQAMETAVSPQAAETWLRENLPRLKQAANEALEALGCDKQAVVTLCREAFPIREYPDFTLPSGIYEALRITIGEGEGHNWWCVAYPSLCLTAAGGDVEAVAADAGISETLRGTMTGRYQIRFFLLDLLGSLGK